MTVKVEVALLFLSVFYIRCDCWFMQSTIRKHYIQNRIEFNVTKIFSLGGGGGVWKL